MSVIKEELIRIEANLRYFRLIIGCLKVLKVKDCIYKAINSQHKEMALWPLSHTCQSIPTLIQSSGKQRSLDQKVKRPANEFVYPNKMHWA